jgi:hypothetical protein
MSTAEIAIGALLSALTYLPWLLIKFVPSRTLGGILAMLIVAGIAQLGPLLSGRDWYDLGYLIGGLAGLGVGLAFAEASPLSERKESANALTGESLTAKGKCCFCGHVGDVHITPADPHWKTREHKHCDVCAHTPAWSACGMEEANFGKTPENMVLIGIIRTTVQCTNRILDTLKAQE